jgi:protein-tyrosine phosphatase
MQYAEKGVEVHFCNVAPTPWTTSIGICYALGALACTALASLSWPWGALLVWPAITLGLVASGYFGLGARVYGKRNGYLPWRWRWLVAPDQWGQEISRRYYRRKRSAAWNAITPRVWMGAWPDDTTSRELLAAGVSAVLDLTAEFPAAPLARSPNVACMYLSLLDLTVPPVEELKRAAAFISEHSAHGIVFIHCKAGYFRSAAVAGAWLLLSGRAGNVDAAIRQLEAARPGLHVRKPVRQALEALARSEPDAAGVGRPIRVRDIQRDDPALFDFIFRLQDHTYRRNRATQGLVLTYEAFRERSAAYLVFGRLPSPDVAGCYPTAAEALDAKLGFILARPLPPYGPPFVCLKVSIMAGHLRGVTDAAAAVLGFGLPVVAAVEPRLANFAIRSGFKVLPAVVSGCLLPIVPRAIIQPPWTYRGVGGAGEVRVTHPQFRDPTTGEPVVYEKTIIYSPGALPRLLHLKNLWAITAAILQRAVRRSSQQ